MNALGMIEVFSFTTAVRVADIAAKASDVKIIAFDRNRPKNADAPAPLVMVVKIEGNVSAVRSAVEAGVEYAKEQGKYIVSHIIPRPAETVEFMAYKMDVNKDKYNKKLPKSFLNVDYPVQEKSAIGLLEIEGLVAAIEGLDSMLKAAKVRLVHTEKRLGGRLVTFVIKGSVSAISAAIDNGIAAANQIGRVYGHEVIANPHDEVIKFFDMGVDE